MKPKQPIRQVPKRSPSPASATAAPAVAGKVTPKSPPRALPKKAADAAPEPAPAEAELPTAEVAEVAATAREAVNAVDIPIADIFVIPDPHRREKEKDELESIQNIAMSMKDLDLIQPVVVKVTETGTYELIAGRKRLKAAELLGWETIPAVIKNYDDKRSEMAMLTENLMRTGYSKVESDKAIAKWGKLYEALHPEAKRGTAGGKAAAAKKASSNGKVASRPRTPSFASTVGKVTGLKERAVQKARKRGETFTDDDYAVFKSKGVPTQDQDKVSAVTDPKKRQAIIKHIADGQDFQKAFDLVMLPPGATSENVGANDAANNARPITDEEFLAACPIRNQVQTKVFDAHALVYRRLIDAKAIVSARFKKARSEFKGLLSKGKNYTTMVNDFLNVPHPEKWLVCGSCSGKGCDECSQGGFKVH